MAKSNNSQKTRMINLLASGKEFSTAQIAHRLSIANPSAVVSQLRDNGHEISTVRYTDKKTGRLVFKYRYEKSARR